MCCARYPAKGQVGAAGGKAQGRKKILAALHTAGGEAQVWNLLLAGLVDAFDAENAGNFADIDENGFELAPVRNFEVSVNARVGAGAIGTAFEVVNVGTGSADDGGDVGKKTGATLR